MKTLKTVVILLALLLAGIAMVPMAGAEDKPAVIQTNNATGDKDYPVIESKVMGPDYSVKDVYMTRQEFADSNAEYLAFLKEKFDLDQAAIDKIIDREYYKGGTPLSKAASSTIIQPPPLWQPPRDIRGNPCRHGFLFLL